VIRDIGWSRSNRFRHVGIQAVLANMLDMRILLDGGGLMERYIVERSTEGYLVLMILHVNVGL
jgi:hypothetical protein